ncbi:hypothetical protein [Zhihengliuella halotolerans]|uniref:hypothetical protein n=1 Tax=Zhihengliuella halotolerans TaxID=370736 RepID=UPI000C8064F4|nr:hypothetical protein [Zhihengliuella halotolerans]
MSGYQLGQRVRMTGTVRRKRDRVSWRPGNPHRIFAEVIEEWQAIKAMPGRPEFGLLRTSLVDSAAPEKPEGLIVGKRTIQQGVTDYDPGEPPCFLPGEHTTVYLVAYDLHRRHVMCTDNQLEPLQEEA